MIATVNEVYDILQAMKNQQENTTGRICRICPSARRPFVRHNPTCNLATLNKYAYSYDDIGNRLSSFDLGTNRTYTANALNQYTSISNLCDSASLREEFIPQYDLDGNQTLIQTSTGVWTVTYNAENRPVLWTCGDKTIEMLFDRMGRRVEYIETSQTSQTVTNRIHRFVYDGYLCVQRLDALSNNLIELSFAWDPTEPVATRPLVMQRNGGWNFFYTHDGNKNVSDVVSFQQARGVPAHYEYAPFGEVTVFATNTAFTAFNVVATNPFRFSSEYADDTLGLVYYNYRHYEPIIGRWLCRDPVEEFASVCLYDFCENYPISYYDTIGTVAPALIYGAVAIAEAVKAAAIEAVLEAAIASAATTIAISIADSLQRTECPKPRCLPCIPPVGTLGYRTDIVPPSKPHFPHKGTHTHIYEVHQSPVSKGCQCFWHEIMTIEGNIPPLGSVPMRGSLAGGGIIYQ